MGYTTSFEGSFLLDKLLSHEHAAYLLSFSETRRMQRDPKKAEKLPDPHRDAVNLPIGKEGGYFVGGPGYGGQDKDESILDYNRPPEGQPSLWCQWVPSGDRTEIEWDGGEKFYEYIEWIEYLIKNFLAPWGYKLNGEVRWQGQDSGDVGKIVIKDNEVQMRLGRITYEGE